MRRNSRVVMGLVALSTSTAMVFAGCSNPNAESGEETPTPAPTTSSSDPTTEAPTPDPTPEPTKETTPDIDPQPVDPVPLPPLEELTISPSGLGPLTIDVAIDFNPGSSLLVWDEDYCAFDAGSPDSGDPGRWVSSYPDDLDPAPGYFVQVVEGVPMRIDLVNSPIPTDRGISIGSSIDELHAAYPGLEAGISDDLSSIWWLATAEGTLVFETQDNTFGALPPGVDEGVILMRILAPGVNPDWQAANSGNIAGACL